MASKYKTLSVSLSCICLGAGPAVAQTPDDAALPGASGLEEIVVTAQRRSERLQDVPIAVTYIGGEAIAGMQMRESLDVARATPNLGVSAIAGSGTQPNFFLRGVGLNDFSLNNSGPVGVYVDEVYISSWGAQNFLLYDMDHVEVLRGPQGTLYGRNTTGGAISFLSRRPTNELDGYVQIEGSRYHSYRAEGAIGGPLRDTVRARLAAVRNYSRGYFENIDTGNHSNGTDATGVRLTVEADLTTNLSARLKVYGDFNRTPFSQYEHLGVLDPLTGGLCSEAQVPANQCVDALGYRDETGFYKGRFDREGKVRRDSYGGSLSLNWTLDQLNLVSVTAYQADDGSLQEESDASPNRLLSVTLDSNAWTLTQELRLLGGGDRTPWILGAYYLREAIKLNNTADLFRELRPITEAIDPVSFPGGFDPVGAALGAPIFLVRTTGTQKTETAALFGQLSVPLATDLKLTAGLRYTWEKRRFNPSATFEEPDFTVPLYSALDLQTSVNNVSGRLALDYKFSANSLLYASVSRGFKSGGFNGGFLLSVEENAPYKPEKLTAYEVGYKYSTAGGRIYANSALFYYDYSDVQVFTLINSGGIPLNVLTNASNAEIKGAELEVGLRPTEALNVSASLGLLDAKLKNYETFGGADFSGNKMVQSPDVTFGFVASYEIELGKAGKIKPQIDFSYKSKHYFSTTNNFLSKQSGYWISNAALMWQSENGSFEVNAFIRNIANKKYLVNSNDLSDLGFVQQIVGTPRTFGVSARVNF